METLENLRKAQNLTLLDVAQELGYKYPSSYRKIETGEQKLKSDQILKLSSLFKVDDKKILNSSYSK
ncbi:helix-turn-helix domain-containing protein [Vagococcus carniphilus]|uniref:helix-turn-helix domain-containing protein n=1 Tax=Vagococcus carniphilus TaxID=218144 RepID=UPI003BAA2AD4